MTAEQKATYDQELIERQLLLPPQKPGPKVKENPFAAVAQELFAAESGEAYVAAAKPKPSDSPPKKPRKKTSRKRKR